MELAWKISNEEHQNSGNVGNRDFYYYNEIQSKLKEHLHFPWISVKDHYGIHVLLLSRKLVKSVQREVYFSYSGEENVTVHCKSILRTISDIILEGNRSDSVVPAEGRLNMFVQRTMTVVRRLQSYEVCVGVAETRYKPLWEFEKSGEVDRNPYGELRYTETFRPFECHLLVSTAGYLKRRCPSCIQTKIRFRAKLARRRNYIASPSTPNVHLDRDQLLWKVQMQQKKLKCNRDQIAKLKRKLQKASSYKGVHIDDRLSEELINICMDYVIFSI